MSRYCSRFILLVSIFISSFPVFAQDNAFASWDRNYKEIELATILEVERNYADSIEQEGDSMQFYFRTDKYRFFATYMGNKRKISKDRKATIQSIFNLTGMDAKMGKSIKHEFEFTSGDERIWMPIQPQLEKSFEGEVQKLSRVYLYTFFINHHSVSNGLQNHFLISEFTNRRKPEYPVANQFEGNSTQRSRIIIKGDSEPMDLSKEPLIVLDGEVLESPEKLQTLDPDNIESIEVIKDSKAFVALYGSAAINGVIIIKTKKKE